MWEKGGEERRRGNYTVKIMVNSQRLSDKLSTLKVFFSHGTNFIYYHANYYFLVSWFSTAEADVLPSIKRNEAQAHSHKACFFLVQTS